MLNLTFFKCCFSIWVRIPNTDLEGPRIQTLNTDPKTVIIRVLKIINKRIALAIPYVTKKQWRVLPPESCPDPLSWSSVADVAVAVAVVALAAPPAAAVAAGPPSSGLISACGPGAGSRGRGGPTPPAWWCALSGTPASGQPCARPATQI